MHGTEILVEILLWTPSGIQSIHPLGVHIALGPSPGLLVLILVLFVLIIITVVV